MKVLTDLNENVPNLAMVQLRMIGLLRRQGKFTKVEEMYEKLATESPDDDTCSFYAIKYSRYLAKVRPSTVRNEGFTICCPADNLTKKFVVRTQNRLSGMCLVCIKLIPANIQIQCNLRISCHVGDIK